MEHLQFAAPAVPARCDFGRSCSAATRTDGPAASNDNGDRARRLALTIPGESVVVDAAEASDSILRAMASARRANALAAARASKRLRWQRLAGALAAWWREAAARRAIAAFRAMPDDRLERAGLNRAELAATIREKLGLTASGG